MKFDRFKLKQKMAERRIETFGELSVLTNIHPSTISVWFSESGGRFNSDTLGAVCRALQCTPNDVLAFEEVLDQPRKEEGSHAVLG